MNAQTAYAKRVLIDESRLASAQQEGAVVGAHRVLLQAFETDVWDLLGPWRQQRGLERDPVAAFRASGLVARLAEERGVASVQSAYESA